MEKRTLSEYCNTIISAIVVIILVSLITSLLFVGHFTDLFSKKETYDAPYASNEEFETYMDEHGQKNGGE